MSKRHRRRVVVAADGTPHPKPSMRISPTAMAYAKTATPTRVNPWTIPKPTPGVAPDAAGMAMDDAFSGLYSYAGSNYGPATGYGEGLGFIGYPALSEMAQRTEYRRLVGTLAQEMTRKFVRLTSSGDGDKNDRVAKLEAAMIKYRVRDVFREAAEHDGYFGIGHIFIDVGVTDPDELKMPLLARKEKIKRGSLKHIRTIEPIWCYPGSFNSISPLRSDFYKPQTWHVMNQEIHHTRLLSLVSREVPDILKPSRMFGGISLTELARDTVTNWLETRKSVNDLLKSFTVWQLKTNMQAALMGGTGDDMFGRAQLFNQLRDTRGLMMVDKETEELGAISASLSGLDNLQAQAQEHQAAVDGMPLIKLVGYTPLGLNSTGEGEMDSWRDRVKAQQEHLYNDPLKHILDVIQLSEFGDVDDTICFEWVSLEEENEAEKAVIRKSDVDNDVSLVNTGVLHPEEVRQRLADSKDSLYHGLDVNDVPDPLIDGGQTDPTGVPSEMHNAPDGDISAISLNGAQVTSMVDIIDQVSAGTLPLPAAIAILTTAFPINENQAKNLMSGVVPGGNKQAADPDEEDSENED